MLLVRGVLVGDLDEAELRGAPEDELLGHPAEVHHRHGRDGEALKREVPRGDRVHGVLRQALEPQQRGDVVPGPPGRTCPASAAEPMGERFTLRYALRDPVDVALDSLEVPLEVVSDGHRLGVLEVSVSGHQKPPVCADERG